MTRSAILSVRITGNANDAIKAFEKATRKAAAFGSFVGNVAAKGVERLWDKLTGFTSDVVNMSDSVDKFKNTMRFAGLDTSAVDKAAKAARKYADETVYGLDDVQNTMAQLAANGIDNYVELTQAAGNLNAVAGGNKDTFKSVAMMLTQTAGAGKLTTENWNQLADAIPGASGKLQEAMLKNGAYTGNFRDAMAKGQITADEFNKALSDLGMTDVARQAATSTQTIEGALGNLEAAVTGGLTDAFNMVKPMVTEALSGAADSIGTFFNNGIAWVQRFTNAFGHTGAVRAAIDLYHKAGDAAQALGNAFGTLVREVFPGIGALRDASSAGKMAGDGFRVMADIAGRALDVLKGLAEWAAGNAGVVTSAAAGIAAGFGAWKIAPTVMSVVNALKAFKGAQTIATAAQWAWNAAMSANPIGIVVTAIGALVAALTYFFTQTEAGREMWSKFMGWLGAAWENLLVVLRPILDAISQAWAALCEYVGAVWDAAIQIVTGLWNSLRPILQPILDWMKVGWKILGDYVQLVWRTVADYIKTIVDIIKNVFKLATSLIRGDWQGVADAVRGIWDAVGRFFGNLVNNIVGFFANACGHIVGFFANAGQSVRDAWNGVLDWFAGLPGRIVGFFEGAGSWLWNAGSAIIGGLWEGLKSSWAGVADWFSGLGGWIQQHKGPPSYDKVMLVENGKYIMQGFATGLQKGWDSRVMPTVKGFNTRLGTMDFAQMVNTASASVYYIDNSTSVNAPVTGTMLDEEGVAREITRILNRYVERRA